MNKKSSFMRRLFSAPTPVVSVIRLHGVIGPSSRFSRNLDDAYVASLIEEAVKPSKLQAIALSINSPGGSPVQARMIAERLRAAARDHKVPLLAFCEDVAASGGYMLACAAEQIFADPASLVGSIGVVSAGFGFDRAIEKIGVERRLHTAGQFKSRLDPFTPERREDVEWLEDLQAQILTQFRQFVQFSRGERLNGDHQAQIFSGDVFLGKTAEAYGLIDGTASMQSVLKERFGEDVDIAPVEKRRGLMERLSGMGGARMGASHQALGAEIAHGVMTELEQSAYWSRYGL